MRTAAIRQQLKKDNDEQVKKLALNSKLIAFYCSRTSNIFKNFSHNFPNSGLIKSPPSGMAKVMSVVVVNVSIGFSLGK